MAEERSGSNKVPSGDNVVRLGKYMRVEVLSTGGFDPRGQYLITNKRSEAPLGRAVWYSRWEQYVFEPVGAEILFNNQCLRDIAAFLDEVNDG